MNLGKRSIIIARFSKCSTANLGLTIEDREAEAIVLFYLVYFCL